MTPTLDPRFTPGASVTPTPNGWRMDIPAGPCRAYRLAQVDDYMHLPRRAFPWDAPLTPREPRGVALSLRARLSDSNLPGTWGFGLWNDPFGFAIGFGGTARRLPALPNAAWFFHASPENYLSLQPCHCEEGRVGGEVSIREERYSTAAVSRPDEAISSRAGIASSGGLDTQRTLLDHPPRNDPSTPFVPRASAARRCETAGSGQASPANGFFAGTFRSPRWPAPLLAPALLALPLLALRPASRLLRRLAGRFVRQDGNAVSVDVTQWHDYSIHWQADAVVFLVDGAEILRTPLAPRGPLGLVLWIDNQYAAWTPQGRLAYGTLENPSAWLEIDKLHYNCA